MHNHFNCPFYTPGGCRPLQQPPYSGFYWPDCPYPGAPYACQNHSESDSSATNPDSAHQQNGSCLITNDLNVGADLTVGGTTHLKGDLTVDGKLIVDGKTILPHDDSTPPAGDDTTTPDDEPGGIAPGQSTIDVSGDGITVSATTVGDARLIRLADVKKGDTNSVGTTHVTDATMPAGSSSEGNMRYKLYNDVTTGNNGAETITLAAGSKLEPAGGVPGKAYGGQGAQIAVEGGELSWVHSSDIGMIQDDESLSDSARQSRGVKNAEILRMVAASRWNLILDGRYYVYIDSGGTANAVQLWRVLRIQGGCLVVKRHLFTLRADRQLPGMSDAEIAALRHGGLVCDGVEFVHETSGKMIHLNPDGGLLECCELRGCTFRGDGQFITGTGGNVVPTSVTGLKYRYSPAHCKEWLGWTDNPSKDSRYKYARDAHTLYVYPYGTAAPSADALSRDDAESVLSAKLPIYIPYTGGEYVFRVSASGALKYKGSYGNFILQSDAQQGDTLYQENGAVVVVTTLDVCDTMVNGVITRNANPPVDIQGARRVVVENCSFLHDASVTGTKNYGRDINFDALPVTEEYVVRGCRFENVRYEAINVGADNERESADEWTLFCCPMVVDGNVFRGWPSVHSTSSSYYCAMVGELETVYFTNNLVERFIGRCSAVYDVYFSCGKVYYRHNTVRNVLPFMAPTKEQLEIKNTDGSYKYTKQSYMSGRLYGYMKAKNTRIGIMLREKEDGNKENPSKPLVRVFEDSKFDCDIKEVRKVCEEFLREWQDAFFSLPDLFPDGGYADVPYEEIPLWAIDRVLEKYVMHTSFPNMTSEWGLSEYTVRGNVWDMPGVRMHGAQVSSGWAVTGRWTVDGNYLRMKSFVSSRADGYDRYLFALWPLSDGSTRVSICGNTFVSDGGEVINLLGLSKEYELGELRMENNRFENCGWRISPRRRSLGEGTDRYDGPVTARELSIRGNDEGDGLDDGWELNPLTGDGLYANNYTLSSGHHSMFYVPGVPHLYIGHGNIELWDSQKNGVAANATKCVLLPRGGKLTLRSHHWCRPCPKYVGATPDTNPSAATGTHIVTAANSSLLEITDITDAEAGVPVTLICGSTASGVHISKSGRFAGITAEWSPAVGNRIRLVKDADGNFTELGRWANTTAQTVGAWANAWDNRALSLVHGLSAMDPVGYAVTVRYRLKGVWKERKLEMRTVATSGDNRAVSARGVDGRRMCCQNTSHAMKMWELGGIDEIGLRFLVSSKDINPAKAASRDYYAPTLRLDLFTDARGTQNDPGTEMTVEVSVMTANADIPTSSALDYADTSLFETFVPKGSVLTAAERTALLTGDRVFWNVVPTVDGGRTYRTLRPVDAGWWCVDPDSGHVVTWKGTAWSE